MTPWTIIAAFKFTSVSGLMKNFKQRLPRHIVSDLDKLLTVRKKIVKTKSRIKFYKECISNNVYDAVIRQRMKTSKISPNNSMAATEFVKAEIEDLEGRLRFLRSTAAGYAQSLDTLQPLDYLKYVKMTCAILRKLRVSSDCKSASFRSRNRRKKKQQTI